MIIGNWLSIKDGDPMAWGLFKRHYSYHQYKDNRRKHARARLIVGPGEKMVLITRHADALFVWRKFIDASGQLGINCSVFRNESDVLSSVLILEAEQLATARWPGERMYTYVNQDKIKSTNPGYCYLAAGWNRCGMTKSGLVILEKNPANSSGSRSETGERIER